MNRWEEEVAEMTTGNTFKNMLFLRVKCEDLKDKSSNYFSLRGLWKLVLLLRGPGIPL